MPSSYLFFLAYPLIAADDRPAGSPSERVYLSPPPTPVQSPVQSPGKASNQLPVEQPRAKTQPLSRALVKRKR